MRMPWGPFKGRKVKRSNEPGHWHVQSRFGWHDCSPTEDQHINEAVSRATDGVVQ